MHRNGEGRAGPSDATLRAIPSFLGFGTRKGEKQNETEGTEQDQGPENTWMTVRQRKKGMAKFWKGLAATVTMEMSWSPQSQLESIGYPRPLSRTVPRLASIFLNGSHVA